ncbi:hypothetical protein DFS34DRAFT_636066 [Phlyctochytrium arcticum]|nr:hypothetical protein DFS34DRAFT_636066 [Phlyctochytrium arcticum]
MRVLSRIASTRYGGSEVSSRTQPDPENIVKTHANLSITDVVPMPHIPGCALLSQTTHERSPTSVDLAPPTPPSSGNVTPRRIRNSDSGEQRQRRLMKNRLAAKECRAKRKNFVSDLTTRLNDMEGENAALRAENVELRRLLEAHGIETPSFVPQPSLKHTVHHGT